MFNISRSLALLIIALAGCNILPEQPTLTPTRALSGATLAPSPTVHIRTSDEIYSEPILNGQNNPTAAALPNSAALPPLVSGTREPGGAQSVQVVLDNGLMIAGEIFEQAGKENRVPGILVIGRDRTAWGLLPSELYGAGLTVLVIELPHNSQIADLETLLTSLSENGTVDPSRIAIMGANELADMALLGCATIAICDVAVLLSPQGRDTLMNVLPNYNPRPLFVAAGLDDAAGHSAASALATTFADGSQYLELAAGSGTELLALNDDLSRSLTVWLRQTFRMI